MKLFKNNIFDDVLRLNINFETLLNINCENLNFFGLNFRRGNLKSSQNLFKICLVTLPIIVICILLVYTQLTINLDRKQFIKNLCHLIAPAMSFQRIIHIIMAEKGFNDLVDHVNRTTVSENVSEAEQGLLKKYVRISRIMSLVLTAMYRLTLASASYLPILFINWYLLYQITIPGLDVHSHPGYEVALVLHVYIIFYTLTTIDLYDSYFYFFTFYVVMRSEYCIRLAKKIGDFDSEFDTDFKQRELLFKLSKVHQDVSNFTFKFANIFSALVLSEGFSSLCLLTAALYIINVDPLYCAAIVSITTTQFFLLCYFGELMLGKTNELSTEIYCSKWYNLRSIEDRQTVVFLLCHTQRKIAFSAYEIYDLSMETFSGFLRKAYGFISFLRSIAY